MSTAAGINKGTANTAAGEDVIKGLQVAQEPEDMSSGDNRTYTLSRASTLPSMSAHPDLKRGPRALLSSKQIENLAQKSSMESDIERQLVSFLPSDLQVQVRTSANVRESLIQVIKDGLVQRPNEQLIACLQKLDDKMTENNDLAMRNNEQGSRIMELVSENKDQLTQIIQLQQELASKQEEMKQLQIQALDRLALLQKSVKALLTQTYELHEYPIPRLFIVLPQSASSWNPVDLLSNKFRLYFLCECGEHTKSINTKIPHHIHLAKHEGYDITSPTEFFQRYGPYVLTILQMLKYGITVAGVAIPALSHLISSDATGQVTEGLKLLKDTLEPGMNQVIDYIVKAPADEGQAVVRLSEQMDNNEALEGADLRQLESFLKNKDSNRVLGNLYRTVTTEGHVKWVCIDHYRENYHAKVARSFSETVGALQGSFDESIGRVEVKLQSKVQAEQLYHALESARSVYELKLVLDWETTQSDFKRLQDMLTKTSVGVLELDLRDTDGPTSDILNRNQRYDPILDIMRHPSIQSFTIRWPHNFSKRSSLLSQNNDFPNLRRLDVSLPHVKEDIPGVKRLVALSTNLSSLGIGTGSSSYEYRQLVELLNAIAEHQAYPITFKDLNFSIPPPPSESSQSVIDDQYLVELMRVYIREARNMELDVDEHKDQVVDILDKAIDNNSAFRKIHLDRKGLLGDSFINNISSIVSKSELDYIRIYTKEDSGRVRILESIQWKHLRRLDIILKPGTFETSVMRTLVDGVTKMSEKVELDQFLFGGETWDPLTLPEGDLLRTFVASTSFKELYLLVDMTPEQTLSLLRSADVSRLRDLILWAESFDSVQVDAILDELQHATNLRYLLLVGASATNEQKRRMKAKGVSFVLKI